MNAVLTKFGLELNAPSLENLMGTIQSASPPHVPASILQTTSPNLCACALGACALCDLASLREKKHPSKLCACALSALALAPSVTLRKKITRPTSAPFILPRVFYGLINFCLLNEPNGNRIQILLNPFKSFHLCSPSP